VECTINGIGERAGNAALEEIVMAMHVRRDRYPYETGIAGEQLFRGQPDAQRNYRRARPAEQSCYRTQRLRPRGWNPPGRGAQESVDLRDYDSAVRGRARFQAGPGQSTPDVMPLNIRCEQARLSVDRRALDGHLSPLCAGWPIKSKQRRRSSPAGIDSRYPQAGGLGHAIVRAAFP